MNSSILSSLVKKEIEKKGYISNLLFAKDDENTIVCIFIIKKIKTQEYKLLIVWNSIPLRKTFYYVINQGKNEKQASNNCRNNYQYSQENNKNWMGLHNNRLTNNEYYNFPLFKSSLLYYESRFLESNSDIVNYSYITNFESELPVIVDYFHRQITTNNDLDLATSEITDNAANKLLFLLNKKAKSLEKKGKKINSNEKSFYSIRFKTLKDFSVAGVSIIHNMFSANDYTYIIFNNFDNLLETKKFLREILEIVEGDILHTSDVMNLPELKKVFKK